MNAILVLLSCAYAWQAKATTRAPDESLTGLLFAQHPTGITRASRTRSANTASPAQPRKVEEPSMVMADILPGLFPKVNLAIIGFLAGDTIAKQINTVKRDDIKDLAGVSAPVGFFDPFGFTQVEDNNQINLYREIEVKNARVAMLAAFGFAVAEKFHPLMEGLPVRETMASIKALEGVPAGTAGNFLFLFWLLCIGEMSQFYVRRSRGGFDFPPAEYVPGDIGFDPLNLKPKDPKGLKRMQTQELNNGRLAMLAAAGMIAQEFQTGQPLEVNPFAQ